MLGSRMTRAADANHLLFAVAADEFAGENECIDVFLLSGKVLVCIADFLNGLPCVFIDQLRVNVGIDGIAVPDFSGIFCVAQHPIDLFVDEIFSFFGADTARFQVVCDFDDGISLRKFRKYLFDDGTFLFVDDNFLIDNAETVQKDPARIIAFQIAFPHPSEYLLRKLGGKILVHAFQEAFQDDAFGTVGDIFHCRHELHAVFFERVFMDRRFILITRKSIKFVNSKAVQILSVMDKYDTVKEAATKYCIGINTIFFALTAKTFSAAATMEKDKEVIILLSVMIF